MKTKSYVILTILSILALSITAQAQNLVVSNSAVTQSGTHYTSNGTGNPALNVSGSLGSFTGSNITLTGTANTGNGRYALLVSNGAYTYLTSSTFASTGTANATVVININSGTLHLQDSKIISVGWNAHGIQSTNAGSIILSGNIDIETSGSQAVGLLSTNTSSIINTGNLKILSTGIGANAANSQINSFMDLGTSAYLRSTSGFGLLANGGTVTGVSTVIVADTGYAIRMTSGGYSGAYVYLKNANITSGGTVIGVVGGVEGNAYTDTLVLDGGSVTAINGDVISSGPSNSGARYAITDIIFKNGVTASAGSGNFINVSGTTTLNFTGENVSLAGNIIGGEASNMTVNLDGSDLTGKITANDSSRTMVNLRNSTLTGATAVSDNAKLNLDLDNSEWHLWQPAQPAPAAKSTLTTLHGANNSTIAIPVVRGDDITVTNGITGQTNLALGTLDPAVQNDQQIRVVADNTNAMPATAFTLAAPIANGLYSYALANRPDGAWLVNSGLSEDGAVINSAVAVQQALWFAQQDSLLKRMGDFHLNPESKIKNPKSLDLWVRGYALQLNARRELAGLAYTQYLYGVDIGADKAWQLRDGTTLLTGLFVGEGWSDINYKIANAASAPDSKLTGWQAGLYATWLRPNGVYVDTVLKAASTKNELNTTDMNTDFTNLNLGASVEVGRRCQLHDQWEGWFIEPQAQLSYFRIFAKDYTAGAMPINAQASDVLQLRISHVISRPIALKSGGELQPYFKVGGAYVEDFGGAKIRNGAQQITSKIDGMVAEGGVGLIWQLTRASQFHFDYEARYAEKYNMPWGLNLGYRLQF